MKIDQMLNPKTFHSSKSVIHLDQNSKKNHQSIKVIDNNS